MNFKPTTVEGFFGKNKIKYTIPQYQRAYSWEKEQLEQFFNDLYEHKDTVSTNPYCFGNILLQTIEDEKNFEIIDGQQRLTTILIFVRCILNEFKLRGLESEEIEVESEIRIFFKDFNQKKFEPVYYDSGCYETLIIENKDEFNCETQSQKRMLNAKIFFKKKLDKNNVGDENLIKIYKILKSSKLTAIELVGNKEAALMFELQNNRGKELTNLEKLKSFFMYQLYVYSLQTETELNIGYIAKKFDPIYKIANDLNEIIIENSDEDKNLLSEDNVLLYHCIAFTEKHFAYRNLTHLTDEFKKVDRNKKVNWIKEFVDELYTTFTNIKKMLTYNDEYLSKLKRLGMPTFIYPFIIKGMKFFRDDKKKMSKLFQILEVLSFRYKLISSRADIRSRLNDAIKDFNGDLKNLIEVFSKKLEEEGYWSDNRMHEVLLGQMYPNFALNYLLWEYEESLQLKGYTLDNLKLENESIEHISPQTENDEGLKSGYEVNDNDKYSEDFIKKYLHCLGNLMLISKSHNSSIGNQPSKEKLESYNNNLLLKQQFEIKDFVDKQNPVWKSDNITKRLTKIFKFACSRWSFENILK